MWETPNVHHPSNITISKPAYLQEHFCRTNYLTITISELQNSTCLQEKTGQYRDNLSNKGLAIQSLASPDRFAGQCFYPPRSVAAGFLPKSKAKWSVSPQCWGGSGAFYVLGDNFLYYS